MIMMLAIVQLVLTWQNLTTNNPPPASCRMSFSPVRYPALVPHSKHHVRSAHCCLMCCHVVQTTYPHPSVFRSSLFKNQSKTLPPVDELELLHSELLLLRQKTLERAKKASDDLKMIWGSMDRINPERGCMSLSHVGTMTSDSYNIENSIR